MSIGARENYVTWIQTALLSVLRLKMVYEHDAVEVEIRIDTSNYDIERPLLIEKINKLIRLMTGGLDWNIMTMFFGLRLKTYLYLVDDFSGDKKAKETK